MRKKVSILMLTHNAPKYVKLTIESLRKHTNNNEYELIVLDNASKKPTRLLLKWFFRKKMIDKVIFSSHNTLFAAGNNIMAHAASPESELYLLLNSDIEIKSDDWLDRLLEVHEKGVSAHGVVESAPTRVDGYCYLIDADLYRKHPLDDRQFQWWWAITKQQADILGEGYKVKGYLNHEKYLHHFGGKSGEGFKGAKGMDMITSLPESWFAGKSIEIIDQ